MPPRSRETDDHARLGPDHVLCTGDLFIWQHPTVGTRRRSAVRNRMGPAPRKMAALELAMLPGHGLPILGADRSGRRSSFATLLEHPTTRRFG